MRRLAAALVAAISTAIVASLLLGARGLQAQAPGAGFSVVEKSIPELQTALKDGRVTSVQLVDAYLERIRAYDKAGPAINAFITLNPNALNEAAALDAERRAKGARGILHGIPIAVKDNYITADMPTTAGSKALDGFIAGRDAFVVRKLREAGAIIIGKTNLHELAYGITTISSQGGQTKNPYALQRTPGGSSGGTGAAVAASFAAAGIGTDTCGSVRIPSANNSLFGLRGTIGLSSRDGIVPLATTQDIGGPLARTVTDLAILLDATVGADPSDVTTRDSGPRIPRTYLGTIGDREVGDIRIGIVPQLFGSAPEDAEVAAIVREAIKALSDLGADVVELDWPWLDAQVQGTSVINFEFKFDLMDFLAPFPSAPVHTLGEIISSGKYDPAIDGVIKRADAATSRQAEAYQTALAKREAARDAVYGAMAQRGITAIAYPTLRRKAAIIGQPQAGSNCQLSATTGFPAMAMPAGFSSDGVPVGLELMGTPFSEPALLKIAYVYEQVIAPRRPPASTP